MAEPLDVDAVERVTRATLAHPSHRHIVDVARAAINRTAAGAYDALALSLARAYAQGYVQGWERARKESGEVMPPPELAP